MGAFSLIAKVGAGGKVMWISPHEGSPRERKRKQELCKIIIKLRCIREKHVKHIYIYIHFYDSSNNSNGNKGI